ncbi:MAG: TraR/DksA family transcriptional regulator [Elusimicrobiota bacterium]
MKRTQNRRKTKTQNRRGTEREIDAKKFGVSLAVFGGGGMNTNNLNKLKKILITKKNDLLKVVNDKKQKDLQEPTVGDEVDVAGDSEEKELIFGLTDNEKLMLNLIDSALKKMETGKYGFCESCAVKIPYTRLEVMPFARYCIKCQPKFDKKR